MATAAVGLITAPAWASRWNQATIQSYLPVDQDVILAELVETIIPTTDTPGAKTLAVHSFVQKMVADCYDTSAQKLLTSQLAALDTLAHQRFTTQFATCTESQKKELIAQLANSKDTDQQTFYKLVKGLTIRGYMTSEYVMTNLTHFQMAPGYYKGCVPVVAQTVSPTSPTKTN